MVNQCDGCCQRARTWWALIDDTHDHDEPELMMCRHHGNQHEDEMVARGWVLVADDRDSLVTPAPVADPAPLTQ